MRVRDWEDIMRDVAESDADPGGWRAVGGDRARGIGEDLYIAHPAMGVFQLKTYAKNPYRVQGVGSRVARSLDDELDPLFPEETAGMFGVQEAPEDEDDAREKAKRLETVLETHADAPTTPDAMIEDVLDAVDAPAYGPMEFEQRDRPDKLEDLSSTFEEAEELLEAEFDEVVEEDVERGFY